MFSTEEFEGACTFGGVGLFFGRRGGGGPLLCGSQSSEEVGFTLMRGSGSESTVVDGAESDELTA